MIASVYYFCISTCFVVAALGESNETVHDLNEGLQSWNRMKRVAGYYTESGVYRGGLWRVASKTESKVYHRLEDASSRCRHWSMQEGNGKRGEYDNCTCTGATDRACCDHWECTTTDVDERDDCTASRESTRCASVGNNTLTCACHSRVPNRRYCSEWSCREEISRIDPKKGDYKCLEEDVTGEYCYRWKGNISSSYAIASSVCECFTRGELFCKHWECRERSMIRCAAHYGGWCSIEIGVGVGGGFGLYFLILTGFFSWFVQSNRVNEDAGCLKVNVIWLMLVVSAETFVPVIIVCLLEICRQHFSLFFGFLLLAPLFCLPWLIGVAIWGGTLACAIVVPIWVGVFILISFMLYYLELPKDRRVHPSSQV